MACKHPYQDERAYGDAIPAKRLEAILGKKAHKPLHGEQGHYESHDTAYEEHYKVLGCGPSRAYGVTAHEKLKHVEPRSGGHGGNGKEERELRGTAARELLAHATNYRGHGAACARNHGQALYHANPKGLFLSDLVLLGALVEELVAKQHEYAANDKHYRHYPYSVGRREHEVDHARLFHDQANDTCRDESHQQQPIEAPLVDELLPTGASSRRWRVVKAEKPVPIEHHYGKYGTKLYDDCKRPHEVGVLYAQQVLRDKHMSRRRNRQELCQAFNNGYYYGL